MNIIFFKPVNAIFNRFKHDENGNTAIEYGLLVALVAVALLVSLHLVATAMNDMFKTMNDVVDVALANDEGDV